MLQAAAIRSFQSRFTGRIILPGDREYNPARRVHNAAIVRRPALIALCASADDVCRAVEFARRHQLLVAVRSGGHSQHGVCDGGIVIDLSGLKQATVDRRRRVARADAGLLAGELDDMTQKVGLATPMGQCPSVGLGGLTTGGGFGWLTGKYGLTCDNLISAQIVTADGRRLRASTTVHPDLFWALRGGGGNYGVALDFEYRLHAVSRVIGGVLSYPMELSRAGFTFMREFLLSAPDELSVSFGIRPVEGKSVFAVALCFCGDPNSAQQVLEPLHLFSAPAAGSIGTMSYLQMQRVMGESPPGDCLYSRGGFIRELSDESIDVSVESAARNPSAVKLLWLDYYHGAMCRVAPGATAFPVRESGYGLLIQSEWSTRADAARQIGWNDETMRAMAPFLEDIAYVANLGDEGPERVRRCYGPNHARLAALKRKYDPGNLFRMNQNILPTDS